MCFTCFSCQFVFNKRFLKIYCLSVYSFFLVSFTSMYTTLKIISRKFLGVSLIWTFCSHVGAIFLETTHIQYCKKNGGTDTKAMGQIEPQFLSDPMSDRIKKFSPTLEEGRHNKCQ